MGLDMYIYQCNRTEHSIDELVDIDNIETFNTETSEFNFLNPETPEAAAFLPLYTHGNFYSIFHEAAYWRKANAIHAWFVHTVQNDVDDCGYYELTQEHLQDLVQICTEAVEKADDILLPPQGGFFFGSIVVDEWYWADLKRTIEQVNNILNKDWSKYRFFYHSSW